MDRASCSTDSFHRNCFACDAEQSVLSMMCITLKVSHVCTYDVVRKCKQYDTKCVGKGKLEDLVKLDRVV